MSLKYAILGCLSWQSLSGYDLKKIFAESDIWHWSGNNNQIYRTLVKLHQEEWVTKEVQPQANRPARKVYTITEAGRDTLRQWVLSAPELPELKNTFLIQLAWADRLSDDELDQLLAQYEEEMRVQLLMAKERKKRKTFVPERTPREAYLWRMIMESRVAFYQGELKWVRKVRQGINRGGAEA